MAKRDSRKRTSGRPAKKKAAARPTSKPAAKAVSKATLKPVSKATPEAVSKAVGRPGGHLVRRALISVWDKTGVVEFARALHEEFGVEIISTGGTAKTLREAGIPVTLVETLTGCGEMLDGRVKTLHPAIHAAILADRDNPEHMRQLEEAGIEPIDLVVVNLYPFERTVAEPGCTFEQAIEMIDIGGVALLRAAAKNHRHVLVPAYADDLPRILIWLREDALSDTGWVRVRRDYAYEVLELTSRYDASVSKWLSSGRRSALHLSMIEELRYGENPQQTSTVVQSADDADARRGLPWADFLRSAATTMSYNNYSDADAALGLCAELARAIHAAQTQPRAGPLWYVLPGGASGLGASSPSASINGETLRRRNLPHIEVPGRTYFLTFRTAGVELPPAARDVVLSVCRHWHGRKMTLHIACVMPDHVHLLLTPYLYLDESAVPLPELQHSIKSFSSNQVNKLLGRSGPLWMQEGFDRVMRHEREFSETWEYIETNAERAGLGERYSWCWNSGTGFEEGGWIEVPVKSGLEARRTGDGLEAHATERKEADHGMEAHDTKSENHVARSALACCVFIKHTNACGVGVADDAIEAYRRAYLGDPNAAMGGILAVNFAVDVEFAAVVMETYERFGRPLREAGARHAPGGFFVEVWIAPGFTEGAVQLIRGSAKKWGQNVRLLAVGDMTQAPDPRELVYRSISGGMLVQSPDHVGLNEEEWRVVTERAPGEREMADLRLAWLICKHTKSNAISIVKDGRLIGNGAGQMSRVMSCRVAVWLARENGHLCESEMPRTAEAEAATASAGKQEGQEESRADGTSGGEGLLPTEERGPVAASDAFFPFADGPNLLMDAGVTAIIQPGGSKRDAETIAACNARGVAMIFTQTRHFRH